MHPLIKEYIETSELFENIAKRYHEKEPSNKLYEKIYETKKKQNLPRKEPLEFDFSDDFLLEKNYDKDLVVLLYQLYATLAYYYHKPDMGHLLFKRADAYIDKSTPPYLLLPTKANIIKGKDFVVFIEDHLLRYSHTSPRYCGAFEIYFFKVACLGVMPQEKLIKLYLENKSYSPNQNRIEMSYFIYYLETFQIAKVNDLKKRIFENSFSIGEGTSQYLEVMPHYKLLYEVLFESNNWPESYFESNKNILTMYYLITRNVKKALQIAKEFFVYDLSPILTFNLVRCELANKNFESAYQCIKKFIEEEEDHHMIFFFYARIEIARGNRELACQYFTKAMEISKKNNAEGLFDFELSLAYELSMSDLRYLLENASKVNSKEISLQKSLLKTESKKKDEIIGNSNAIADIKAKIKNYADSEIPVLITGETGVGKDLIAKALHQQSKRKSDAFYAINCGSLSESLLLSELFGHEAGSFTGANKAHKGLFEAVGKGTIFLDEIGEITPALQIALLRVLDQNEFKAVGSNTFKKCQCRILFATNADLEKMVEDKSFRKDLLFRLKRLEIFIPPLRDRKEDIPDLVKHYFVLGRSDQISPAIDPELIKAFQAYSWPGNIRQLKNEIEKMRVLHSEKLNYTLMDFPFQDKEKNLGDKKETENTNTQKPRVKGNDYAVENVLSNSKSAIRRLDKIKNLFVEHKKFTRKELIEITQFAPKTITRDLEQLCKNGVIERIMPSTTARTHYFVLK